MSGNGQGTPDAPKFTYRVAGDYYNEKGQRIQERELLTGLKPDGWSRFVGYGTMKAEYRGIELTEEVWFAVNGADTHVEAFAKLDAAFEAARPDIASGMIKKIQQLIAQQQAQNIAIAQNMPCNVKRPPGLYRG